MKMVLSFAAVMTAAVVSAASPKYVFLFIGDGMAVPQRMVAEEFSLATGNGPLAMNALPYQATVRTKSADAIITDSAAAATAIACGEKTKNGMIGVRPDGSRLKSVAEAAAARGMKVGIVTTVTVVHATPAGFYAHRANRGDSYRIALDLVASGFDYFAAGGVYDRFDDVKDPEYRGNVFELAKKSGYTVCIDDRNAWAALKPGSKSWSVFGADGMQFSIDADGSQPTLAEMVGKGVELLDQPRGFFMMCEGGKVDYAGHANDAATDLREVLALDDAVKVALEFQSRRPDETLVVVTGDHETGGMSMGFAGTGGKFIVELLAKQKTSAGQFSEDMKKYIAARGGKVEFEEVKPVLTRKFGLEFGDGGDRRMRVTAAEERALAKAFAEDVVRVRKRLKDTTAHDVARLYVFAQAAKNVLNAHAGVGWSSGSHTALPALTSAKGPGAEMLVGMSDNTDIGKRMKKLFE
ncbi:MAG: alkaline phosphatase [Kiritimatiellae bacterium]|nr:alkaline phosphatase [Kiritimatiellia bacterium]